MTTALILLGIGALAVVVGVTYWKSRPRHLFLGKEQPGNRTLTGGLVRSRDFFFGKPEDEDLNEPLLGRLDEGLNQDSSPPGILDKDSADNSTDSGAFHAPPERDTTQSAAPAVVSDDAEADSGSVKQIDYWVRVIGDEPVERDRILAIYREHDYLLEHNHSIHGRSVPSGEWCNIEKEPESTQFTDLVMTLQLCDHNGPVSESELTRFTNLVFALSESLDRKFKFQSTVEEAQELAKRLDRFCQENDVLAIINICGEGDRLFKGPEVLRAVEGSGMRYGDLKVFHGPDNENGDPIYSLANMIKPGVFELDKMKGFTTPGLTMFMSVPLCANPADVFSRMAYVAGKISRQLGGVMLDQKRQPLDEAAVKQIRRQVTEMNAAMTNKGVPPGSEEALRLFS